MDLRQVADIERLLGFLAFLTAWPEPWPSSAYVIALLLPASIVLEIGDVISGLSPFALRTIPDREIFHYVASIGRCYFLFRLAGTLAFFCLRHPALPSGLCNNP